LPACGRLSVNGQQERSRRVIARAGSLAGAFAVEGVGLGPPVNGS
jgi:hypothetical protein